MEEFGGLVLLLVSVFTLFYMAVITDMNNRDKSKKTIPKWQNDFVGWVQPLLVFGSLIAVIVSAYDFRKSLK